MNLRNAVVIITGGGTGIGRATAILFAEHGAKVVVCGRRLEPIKETVWLINKRGGDAVALPCDVRESADVSLMVETVLQQFNKIDILVNNAGIADAKPIMDTAEEEWDKMLDTNLKGIFLCCKGVLPSMVEASKGLILNVSSILGKKGIANFGAYSASKFGVIGLTQALAAELKPRGIRFYTVCPGATYTDLHSGIVGVEMAKVAMPPEKVAIKIVGLATQEILLPSGESLVVDEQDASLVFSEAQDKWRQVAKKWLKPALPMLRAIRGLIR